MDVKRKVTSNHLKSLDLLKLYNQSIKNDKNKEEDKIKRKKEKIIKKYLSKDIERIKSFIILGYDCCCTRFCKEYLFAINGKAVKEYLNDLVNYLNESFDTFKFSIGNDLEDSYYICWKVKEEYKNAKQ